jgi:2-polyprenyl-3-methyl-5-hydroxy-6-metoxy-1,4-benzoquinol methylase
MDQPGLDVRAHQRALAALGRANLVSRTAAALWPAIRRAADPGGTAPLRILDLACGGGHVALDLARRAARAGVAIDVVGYDSSPVAVDFARSLAAREGVGTVRFVRGDAVRGTWPDGIDVVVCTLFLHHLDDEDARSLLARAKDAAQRLVVVSDLRRSRLGYFFAWVGCRLLSRSHVFHVDGARSVAAAFTPEEAEALASGAGLTGARVSAHWPQRWLLTWRPERP